MAEVQKDLWMSSGPTPLHKPLQAGGGGGHRYCVGLDWVGLGWLVGWLAVVGFFVVLLLLFMFVCLFVDNSIVTLLLV